MRRWLRNLAFGALLSLSLVAAGILGLYGGYLQDLSYREKVSYDTLLLYTRTCVMTVDDQVMHLIHVMDTKVLENLTMTLLLCNTMMEALPRQSMTDDQDFSLGQARLFLDSFLELADEISRKEMELEVLYLTKLPGIDLEDPVNGKIISLELEQDERVREMVKFRKRIFWELGEAG